MSEALKNKQQAADYCGVTVKDLMYQVKRGNGPAHVRPSPKTIFFTPSALDAWLASWKKA